MDALSWVLAIAGVASIIFLVAVCAVAFVQVLRDKKLDSPSQAAWLLFIGFIPIAGAVGWFVIREHNIDREPRPMEPLTVPAAPSSESAVAGA